MGSAQTTQVLVGTRVPVRQDAEPVADTSARGRGDAGAGLFGLSMGLLVFLLMLLFAMQVLLGLYARTVTSGAAFDAAQHLARRHGDTAGATKIVYGELSSAVVMKHGNVSADPNYVEYVIEVKPPTFLTGDWWTGSGSITRKARVRVERLQGAP